MSRTIAAFCAGALLFGALALAGGPSTARVSSVPFSPPASTATSATAPLVDTGGVLSCTAAGATSGGCVTLSSGVLVVDAGFLVQAGATSEPVTIGARSITFENGSSDWILAKAADGTAQDFGLFSGGVSIVQWSGATAVATFAYPIVASGDIGTVRSFLFHTTPTITGFGGTGAAISASNGSNVLDINVGTVAPGNTGTITFPSVTTGWECKCRNKTTTSALNEIIVTSDTQTTCVIAQVVVATGSAANFTASDHLRCTAFPL